jgi:hypothetical protein
LQRRVRAFSWRSSIERWGCLSILSQLQHTIVIVEVHKLDLPSFNSFPVAAEALAA